MLRSTSSASCRVCITNSRSLRSGYYKEPMEVGPTTHYIMGGVRVDADSQMTSIPGLFAAGECAAGLHGANRLGGNSLSDLLVFGQRAGAYAATYAKETPEGAIREDQINDIVNGLWNPLKWEKKANTKIPIKFNPTFRNEMQKLVGIVRMEKELSQAIDKIAAFRERISRVGCDGNRTYNPGWHTAMELKHMITVAEAIARAAKERKESRGGHFREDFPIKVKRIGNVNITIRKESDGQDERYARAKAEIRKTFRRS